MESIECSEVAPALLQISSYSVGRHRKAAFSQATEVDLPRKTPKVEAVLWYEEPSDGQRLDDFDSRAEFERRMIWAYTFHLVHGV